MSKHNLVINCDYTLFDKRGRLIKSAGTNNKPTSEGILEIQSGTRSLTTPVRSLFSGFLTFNFNIADRDRYSCRMTNYADANITYSGIIRANHHGGTSFILREQTKTICPAIPHLTEDENHNPIIQMILSRSGIVDGSGKSISQVAIGYGSYSRDQVKDILPQAFALNDRDQFKITYTLNFPVSTTAMLTQNFFYNWLGTAVGNVNFTKIDGTQTANNTNEGSATLASLSAGENCIQVGAGVGDKGLVLGTSNDPVSWDDYNLHGPVTSDVLYPSATSSADCLIYTGSDTNGYIMCARSFTNVSQEAITVKEAGVISKVTHTNATASPGSFLMARWLLPEPVTVQPEETLRVYFRPTIVAS